MFEHSARSDSFPPDANCYRDCRLISNLSNWSGRTDGCPMTRLKLVASSLLLGAVATTMAGWCWSYQLVTRTAPPSACINLSGVSGTKSHKTTHDPNSWNDCGSIQTYGCSKCTSTSTPQIGTTRYYSNVDCRGIVVYTNTHTESINVGSMKKC